MTYPAEVILARLKTVKPETWVEHTPSGLAYHLTEDLANAGFLTTTQFKPEPPLKNGDCGGRYWHDEHIFALRTANGGHTRLKCKGRS